MPHPRLAAVFAALAVGVAAPSTAEAPATAWRLVRVFEPLPGPQRGLDVWVSEADLAAAAAGRSDAKRIRTLVRTKVDAAGAAQAWSIGTTIYRCGPATARSLGYETFGADGTRTSHPGGGEHGMVPHTAEGFVFNAVCRGADLELAPRAASVEEALAIDARLDADHRDAVAAHARAAAEAAAAPPKPAGPCERSRTRNFLFADVRAERPEAAQGWEPIGAPRWGVSQGRSSLGYATLAAGPNVREGLTQRGLSLEPGRYAVTLAAANVGETPVKVRVVVREGPARADDRASPQVAVVETTSLTGSALGLQTLELELAGAADTLAVFAVPADDAGGTGFASVTMICIDPRG